MLQLNSPPPQPKIDGSDRPRITQPEPTSNSRTPNDSVRNIIITFSIQSGSIVIGSVLYFRLHQIDLIAFFNHTGGLTPSGFDFVSASLAVATTFEVLCWASLATTLRWIHTGITTSKTPAFHPVRHLIEWIADLIATPIVAAVIAFGLRSSQISFGQSLNLSLHDADIGWFILLGFLLGFFSGAPRSILSRVRSHTLPPNREGQKRKSTRKNRVNNSKKPRLAGLAAGAEPPGKISQ